MRSDDFSKLRAPKSHRQGRSGRSRSRQPHGAGTPSAKARGASAVLPPARRRAATVTAAGCTVSSPETAILIKGRETRGTFISPDSQLNEQGKGQEGAPKNQGGGVRRVGGLLRACWGPRGTHLRSLPTRGRGLHGRVGDGTKFHSQSLKRFSAQSWLPGWADPLLRQQPRSFATMMSFHLSPPRPRHAGSRGPARGTCVCTALPGDPHHTHSPPAPRAGPGAGDAPSPGLTRSLLP